MEKRKRLLSMTASLVTGLAMTVAFSANGQHRGNKKYKALTSEDTDSTPTLRIDGRSALHGAGRGVSTDSAQTHIVLTVPGLFIEDVQQDSERFQKLTLDGFVTTSEVGKPAVPLKVLTLEIPNGNRPAVSIRMHEEATIDDVTVYPAQETPLDSDVGASPEFKMDTAFYKDNKTYPVSPVNAVNVITVRDKHYAMIEIAPVRVIPGKKQVRVSTHLELDVDVAMDAAGVAAGSSLPKVVDHLSESAALPLNPLKYMILVNDQFVGNTKLNEFIKWKKQKGYDVNIVWMSQINSGGTATYDDVLAFMRGLSDEEYPAYLLIVGDARSTLGVPGKSFFTSWGAHTDLYLACRDDADFFPDLSYGRLPAADNAALTAMLDNVLTMDRNPPDNEMYDNVVLTGEIQDADQDNVADRRFCETIDTVANYFEADDNGIGYECTRAIVNPDGVTSEALFNSNGLLWSGQPITQRVFDTFVSLDDARSRLFNEINDGISMIMYRDHGDFQGWGDPEFDYSDVAALTNGDALPLVLSVACSTGAYMEGNNFAEAWITHNDGGAHAVVAAVDDSPSWHNDVFAHGMMSAMNDDYITSVNASVAPDYALNLTPPVMFETGSADKLGEVLNNGLLYAAEYYGTGDVTTETLFKLYHLFGDPEADVRVHPPRPIDVTHPTRVDIGTTDVTVSVDEDGLLVGLYGDKVDVHAAGYTSGGEVSFPISAQTRGAVIVTVSGNNTKPYQGAVFVGPPVIGDVNADGDVKIVDALQIAQYYVGVSTVPFDVEAADVNLDGVVNIVDALLVAQYYVGVISELPPSTVE